MDKTIGVGSATLTYTECEGDEWITVESSCDPDSVYFFREAWSDFVECVRQMDEFMKGLP